ncbi:MAG: hypothetical protein ABSB12_00330, partial [Candidatus Saccharimonadales bacterium]
MHKNTPLKRVLLSYVVKPLFFVFLGILFFVSTNDLQPITLVNATPPNTTLNFQARLMTIAGAIVPDGNYNVEFKIYNAATSTGSSQGTCSGDSNCLWVETRTGANVVRVYNGYLSVSLGSVNNTLASLNWDQQLWLGVNIGGTGTPSWDGEMTPRIQLTTSP